MTTSLKKVLDIPRIERAESKRDNDLIRNTTNDGDDDYDDDDIIHPAIHDCSDPSLLPTSSGHEDKPIKKRLRTRYKTKAERKLDRKSLRNQMALTELANYIVEGKKVVIISGAGLSVASGVRPFRTTMKVKHGKIGGALPGIWNDVIWTTATRECFTQDPLTWYNEFWIPHFHTTKPDGTPHTPNAGHDALQQLLNRYPNVCQITQNIDALQSHERLVEAHGHLGLYKCLGDGKDGEGDDHDGSWDDDDNIERHVHLGHRRSIRKAQKRSLSGKVCPYQFAKSLTADQLEPLAARNLLLQLQELQKSGLSSQLKGCAHSPPLLTVAPVCPFCSSPVMPQSLLFDEGYHSHSFYQCERIEDWLAEADALVFVGTSFAVRITAIALEQAKNAGLRVFNFNLHDLLKSSGRLKASNIIGPAAEVLPKLAQACQRREHQKMAAEALASYMEVYMISSTNSSSSASSITAAVAVTTSVGDDDDNDKGCDDLKKQSDFKASNGCPVSRCKLVDEHKQTHFVKANCIEQGHQIYQMHGK